MLRVCEKITSTFCDLFARILRHKRFTIFQYYSPFYSSTTNKNPHKISQPILSQTLNNKKILRQKMIKERQDLSLDKVEEKSRLICAQIENQEKFQKAKNILFYYAKDNEVNLNTLMVKTLAKKEKNVFLPRLERDKEISVRSYNIGDKLQTSFYDIKEPLASSQTFKKEDVDLVILPCVASNKECFRLGFGMGCYDRFLENFKGKSIIASFYFQITEIPKESHDQKADFVITESMIYSKKNK